jgi:DNA-binding NarL/FixJ family response regulator
MQDTIDIPNLSVILIDDHEIFCQGIAEIFNNMNNKSHFRYFTDIEKAKEGMAKTKFQFLLCDLLIPGANVKKFIVDCRKQYPDLFVIIVSALIDVTTIKEYFNLGINGFISKGVSYYELKLGLEKVYHGERYISSDLSSRLTYSYFSAEKTNLTPKELEVLRLVAAGNTVNTIAKILNSSPYTIMAHRRNMMKKLDLHSASELVKYAFINNLT